MMVKDIAGPHLKNPAFIYKSIYINWGNFKNEVKI